MGRSRLSRRSNSKGLKITLWILIAVEAVLTGFLLNTIIGKNMLPIKYTAIFIGVIAGIIVLDLIAMKKKMVKYSDDHSFCYRIFRIGISCEFHRSRYQHA